MCSDRSHRQSVGVGIFQDYETISKYTRLKVLNSGVIRRHCDYTVTMLCNTITFIDIHFKQVIYIITRRKHYLTILQINHT